MSIDMKTLEQVLRLLKSAMWNLGQVFPDLQDPETITYAHDARTHLVEGIELLEGAGVKPAPPEREGEG